MTLKEAISIGLPAAALLMFAGPAMADPYLPGLTNLNFTQYNGSAPKGAFTDVQPVGWTGGSGLIYIASPTPGAQAADTVGGTITTYGNPSPNLPGNYVEADGNPTYESGFSVSLSGLTVGQKYTLQFYQGASQQDSPQFTAATTNQWIVSLGTSGLFVPNVAGCGQGGATLPCTYTTNDPGADIEASPLMNVPGEGTVGWESVTLSLTADASTDLLSFLAWGDGGSEVNEPPIAFLTGVDSPNELPEPASLSLLGAGLLCLGGATLRLRGKRKA